MAAKQLVLMTKEKYADMQDRLNNNNNDNNDRPEHDEGNSETLTQPKDFEVSAKQNTDKEAAATATVVRDMPDERENKQNIPVIFQDELQKIKHSVLKSKTERILYYILNHGRASLYFDESRMLFLNGKSVPLRQVLSLIKRFIKGPDESTSISNEQRQFSQELARMQDLRDVVTSDGGVKRTASMKLPGHRDIASKKKKNSVKRLK